MRFRPLDAADGTSMTSSRLFKVNVPVAMRLPTLVVLRGVL